MFARRPLPPSAGGTGCTGPGKKNEGGISSRGNGEGVSPSNGDLCTRVPVPNAGAGVLSLAADVLPLDAEVLPLATDVLPLIL